MAKSVVIKLDVDSKKALKNVGDLTNEMELTVNTLGDMRKAAGALEEELESTDVSTKRYKELRKELIKVNTEIKNQELSMEALDNEQVASELKSVAGGLTDMAGGFALVGVAGKSMEEVVQTMAKVEGASRIVTGAMEAYSSMTKLASTVTGVFNAVLNMNPISLIVIAILALIAGIVALVMNIKKVIGWFKQMAIFILNLLGPLGAVIKVMTGLGSAHNEVATKSAIANAVIIKNLEEQITKSKELRAEIEERRVKTLDAYQDEIDKLEALGEDYSKIKSEMLQKDAESKKEQADLRKKEEKDALEIFNREKGTNYQSIEMAIDAYETKKKLSNKLLTGFIDVDLKYLKTVQKTTKTVVDLWKEANNAVLKDKKEKEDKALEDYKNYLSRLEEFAQAETNLTKLKADYDKLVNDKMLENLEKQLDDKEITLEQFVERSKKIKEKEKDANIKVENEQYEDSKQKLENALKTGETSRKQYNIDMEVLEQEHTNKLLSIDLKYTSDVEAIDEDAKKRKEANLKEELKAIINSNKIRTELLKANNEVENQLREKELKDFEKNLGKKIGSYKEYQKKKEEFAKQKLKDEKKLETKRYSDELNDLELQYKSGKIKYEDYLVKKEEMFRRHQANLQGMQNEADATEELDRKEKLDNLMNDIQLSLDTVSEFLNITQQALSMQAENAEAEREERYSKAEEVLKASLTNREISQKEHDNKLKILRQKKEAEELRAKKKAFNREKAMAISEVAIKLASSLAGIWTNAMANPTNAVTFGAAGITQAAILTALVTATSAAQIGMISAEKFHAARGGKVPGQPSTVDTVDAKLAQGEMVINAQSSEMFGGLLSDINQAGGGIPLVPDAPTQTNQRQDVYGQPQVVKAYVVETEFSEVAERNRRIERRSSI